MDSTVCNVRDSNRMDGMGVLIVVLRVQILVDHEH